MIAEEALKLLKEGNKRYQEGNYQHPNTDVARRDSQTEVKPHLLLF